MTTDDQHLTTQPDPAPTDAVPAAAGPKHRREPPPPRRRATLWTLATLVALAALGATSWTACGARSQAVMQPASPAAPPAAAVASDPVTPPRPVSPLLLGTLPAATTFGTVNAAPDPGPGAASSGRLVHPRDTVPVFDSPGGAPIAALPSTELVSDTWLPVVAEQPGWAEVLLPSRPNDRAGWLYLDDTVTTAHSPYRIEVDRAHFALTLFKDSNAIGHWTVGTGKPDSPTPATHTFLLASIKDTHPTFSPIVLPTGAHSDTYESYGGGPGTVGLHTWPSADVYGHPSSDGCIRIPPDALQVISTTVPIGSPVLIR